MKFSLEQDAGGLRLRGYEPGRILTDNGAYTTSLLIMGELLDPGWAPQRVEDLAGGHVADLVRHRPEIVIVGTGVRQVFPDARVFVQLMDAGIGYEVMDTGAACRTYTVLRAEGRKVLAALFP
jgi:uncharacterized protein